MTLIIEKENLKEVKILLDSKLKNEQKKGNLSKHFGRLKRNIDGLEYQIKMRQNED